MYLSCIGLFFFNQNTAYEMRISDWSSDVCSSDLLALFAPRQASGRDSRTDTGPYRRAVRDRRILEILYEDFAGLRSERRVRPLGLLFYGSKWLLAAWCELRRDFRTFRLDRVAAALVTDERFRPEPGRTLADFLDRWSE